MLELDPVQVLRKGGVAVAEASLPLDGQEVLAIVGPNGAGLSTLLRAISGLNPPSSRRLTDQGHDLARLPPRAILAHGVAQVPEGRQLFPNLTVQQNIWLGGFLKDRKRREDGVARMFTLFPRLAERRHQLAGSLNGGEQQILAIARALASEPRSLLLDKPSVGLSPKMIGTIGDVLQGIQQTGIAILLVEQNIALAHELASQAYVLVTGRVAAEGSAADILTAERLAACYLGADQHKDNRP